MVKYIFFTSCLVCSSSYAENIWTQSREDSLLSKRCLNILNIYKSKDAGKYLAEFSDKWIGIFGKDYFLQDLEAKSKNFKKKYNNKPKEVKLTKIENVSPHHREVKELGVTKSKKIVFYMKGERASAVALCKFNKIGGKWFLRRAPLP